MARKNRISPPDGIFHVTTRIANRQFLLADREFKDNIVVWMHEIAKFCGIELLSYAIMDNHLHIFLHTPVVPKKYWADQAGTVPADDAKGTVPAGTEPAGDATGTVPAGGEPLPPCPEYFGMRPIECNTPMWMPGIADDPVPVTAAGEPLSREAVEASVREGIPPVMPPRIGVRFMLSDEEMIERLRHLYANWSNKASEIEKNWRHMRASGQGAAVDQWKERLCRRMYNLTQYVKVFKERISAAYRREIDKDHVGTLWEGRFHSGVVANEPKAKMLVAAYIGYNPVKAGIVKRAADFKWSSWADACDAASPRSEHYRNVYSSLFACSWDEAKSRMESLFAAKSTPAMKDEYEMLELIEGRDDGESAEITADDGIGWIGTLIRMKISAMTKSAYVAFDENIVKKVAATLPARFRLPGTKYIMRLKKMRRAAMLLAA